MKKANSPRNDTGGAASGLTVKEIDEWLELWRQVKTLGLSEPPKATKLWEKCQEKAAQESSKESQRRAAECLLGPSGGVKRRMTNGERKRVGEIIERSVGFRAEQLYRKKDKKCAEAVESRDAGMKTLMEKIDHRIHAQGEDLPAFLRFEDDESASRRLWDWSWNRLRYSLSVGDVVAACRGPVKRIIGALQAERGKVERQAAKTKPRGKTGGKSRTAWKPPSGYIGSKTIEANYGVPRTTLEGWSQRHPPEKEVKDPQTQECYYPEKWVEERLKSYKPRKTT